MTIDDIRVGDVLRWKDSGAMYRVAYIHGRGDFSWAYLDDSDKGRTYRAQYQSMDKWEYDVFLSEVSRTNLNG